MIKVNRKLNYLKTPAGEIAFRITRSNRRRYIEITIPEFTPEVQVKAPNYTNLQDIHNFINEKAYWIQLKLKQSHATYELIKERKYADGHEFLFLGEKYPLAVVNAAIQRPKIAFNGEGWQVTLPATAPADQREEVVKALLIKWYRRQASEIFGSRVFHFSRVMALKPLKIAVKTQKRIWGSCDHRGKRISLNWMLVLSPLDVIDYVVVHELCHLAVPDHSKRFWSKVERYLPDYKRRQVWLRINHLDMVLP